MKRSIDREDPFDLTIEEKLFLGAKRVCVTFAAAAVTLGFLDLLEIRSVETAADFWTNNRPRIAAMAATVKTGIQSISIAPSDVAVAVSVPIPKSDPLSPAEQAQAGPVRSAPSPVEELAAAHGKDAITVAMVTPPAFNPPSAPAKPQPVKTVEPAPAPAIVTPATKITDKITDKIAESAPTPPAEPVKLASAAPDHVPSSAPVLASLPAPELAPNPIPLDLVPMPPPAPGVPPLSPAQRLKLEGAERAKAERCLTEAIYFEARSEPARGQMAVAQVVINRVFSPFYPNDVCSVVYQNAHRHLACQFTFACEGKRLRVTEMGNWVRAKRIAQQALDGQVFLPEVGKSTHYHAVYVHPYWVREMRKMVRYGVHAFYRPHAWGNGSDEPVWSRAEANALKAEKLKTAGH